MKRRAVLAILAGLVAGALLACVGLGALGMRQAGNTTLAAARARWQAQPLAHYRLVVRESTGAGDCRQDLEISAEQIVRVRENQCVHVPGWTVSNLFTWVAGLNAQARRCYPSEVTCVCYAHYSAEARYDSQLGYPLAITYRWHLETNWAYSGHWERLWRVHELPSCAAIARRTSDFTTITVLALTPLP